MKLFNFLRKDKKTKKVNIQSLNKKQLSIVVGGTDESLGGKAHYGSSSSGKNL